MPRPRCTRSASLACAAAIAVLVASAWLPHAVLAQGAAGGSGREAATAARESVSVVPVVARLQQTLQTLVETNLLSSFSGASYSAGQASERLAAVAAGGGAKVEDLNLPDITAAVAKKAGELVAPLFAQMEEIGADFNTLVANSRDEEQKPADKCGSWPEETGWLKTGSAFAHPPGARSIDSRSASEFCSFFPPMQDYLVGMQAMPAVHAAEYATPKGEFFVYNLRDRTAYDLAEDYDVRQESWYKESSTVRKDLVLVVGMPRSLKISLGTADAIALVEGAFNMTLSFLSEDDFFQVIVSGYSSPCFPPQYLVLANEANKMKALAFLREQVTRETPMAKSTVAAASRLAWKMLSDSERDGYTANCSRSVVYVTDGLLAQAEAQEAVTVVNELQAQGPMAQVFALSLGDGPCPLCDDLICASQGVHIKLARSENTSTYRSKFAALVATHAAFLDGGSVQVGKPLFFEASGDYEMIMSKPILFVNDGGSVELHGVLALSVDINYVIQELLSLNVTRSMHYYTSIFYSDVRPGLLLFHPQLQQMMAVSTYSHMSIRQAEGCVCPLVLRSHDLSLSLSVSLFLSLSLPPPFPSSLPPSLPPSLALAFSLSLACSFPLSPLLLC